MKSTFVLNLILILLINILVKPLYIFGIDLEVQNLLGPGQYGVFFTLFSFTYLFQIINDFGIQAYNTRTIAIRPEGLVGHLRGFLRLKLGLAVLYTSIIWVVAWFLGYTIYGPLLLFIMLNQILISLVLYLRSNISGLGLYRTDSILSATDKAVMIAVCGILLYIPGLREHFSLATFVYAQTFSLTVSAILALGVILRHRPREDKGADSPVPISALFRAAGPYALAVFLMTIYTRIDTVMIEQMLDNGTREAGVYAAGFRLLDAVNMIAFLFTPLLLPMFSKVLNDRLQLTTLLKTGFEIMWVLCISVALYGWVFRGEIMPLLYSASDAHWVRVFGYLILGYIPMGLAYVFGTLQTARGNMRKLNVLYGTLVLCNIILNFILIPRLAAEGAAIATLTTQGLATVILVLFAIRDYSIRVDVVYLLRVLGFAILAGAGFIALDKMLPADLLYKTGAALIFTLLISGLTGLLRPGKLVALLRNRAEKTGDTA